MHNFKKMTTEIFLFVFNFILIAIFLPFRQADLIASASLQGTKEQCKKVEILFNEGLDPRTEFLKQSSDDKKT